MKELALRVGGVHGNVQGTEVSWLAADLNFAESPGCPSGSSSVGLVIGRVSIALSVILIINTDTGRCKGDDGGNREEEVVHYQALQHCLFRSSIAFPRC